jgi:hypothetical protein
LRQRAVTHHVGKHDGSEFALFGGFRRHGSIRRDPVLANSKHRARN